MGDIQGGVVPLVQILPKQSAMPPRPPLRLLIGFSPGSASDIVARIVAPRLGAALDRPVAIESHLGANGAHAAEHLARADPAGGTLFIATLGTHAISRVLHEQPAGDPLNDCAPIALLARAPLV